MEYEPSSVARVALVAASNGLSTNQKTRDSRFSVAALWSMAAENDVEIDDELTQSQKLLRELKLKISSQSKRNFILERDVRYLDGRIALLIQNKMALSEQQDMASHLDDMEQIEGTLDDRKRQLYGALFYLLQSEPKHMAGLARLVSLSQIDTLLQTIMFTLFGNQYETREEYLLLLMFQNVLAAEFESASSIANVMRANTPVSRMMTTYTRRGPGQAYLKYILGDRVNKIISLPDLDLEINPLKVYDQMIKDIEAATNAECPLPKTVTTEVAASNPDVQAIIAPRVKTLMEIAASILSVIISSVDHIPYGIRWICKQIRSLTKRKFPDCTEAQKCSLIGGFFLLRFVNPAIVTPHAYMLCEGETKKNPRRTFTLVAKLLQNLANKPTHSKEPFMAVLNPFVDHNEGRFQKFLNSICDIGEFNEALEMEQYIALSKKEIMLNISFNEIYTTHQYLAEFLDQLCPEPDGKLRICVQELGPVPKTLPRNENRTTTLALFSKWGQSKIGSNSAGSADTLTRAEFLYYDTKALLVQILRLLPQFSKRRNLALQDLIKTASTSREAVLVQKGIKVADMVEELIELKRVSRDDNFRLLTEEVMEEFNYLGSLRENVAKEIKSLEVVYKTIQDHNNYLVAQLETYKAYLLNVRNQAGPAAARQKPQKKQAVPIKYSYQKLLSEGIICESNVPENRRSNVYFTFYSPDTGSYLISMYYKGRETALLELDVKLDDLLEKQQLGENMLDLEYVFFDVPKTLVLLNDLFLRQ